jgi:hypothetical protein
MLRFRRPSRRVARLAVATAFATAFVAPASASAGVLDSLSGWWPMYEGGGQTVHDLSGRGNHGQLGSSAGADANDPTWIRGFLFGSGLRFDGNDFVRIPDSPALQPTVLTVSAWVRAAQSPGTFRYILGKGGDACRSSSFALDTWSSGGLEFYVYDGTARTSTPDIPPSQIWDGKWHHIAGTWDGLNARLFLDGTLAGTSAAGSGPSYTLPTTNDTGIGAYLGSCDLFFTGDIDQVAILRQALPVDQIWAKWRSRFPRPWR